MKKLFFVAVVLLTASAAQAQTRFGAQIDYSTSTYAGLGFGGHGEFFFKDNMAIQGAFDYFLEKDTWSAWTISADFHYYFAESGSSKFYGLGGLGYYSYKSSYDPGSIFGVPLGTYGTFSGVGINLGVGGTFGDGNVLPFAEAKFLSGISGLVLTAGVKFGGGN